MNSTQDKRALQRQEAPVGCGTLYHAESDEELWEHAEDILAYIYNLTCILQNVIVWNNEIALVPPGHKELLNPNRVHNI